MCLHKGQRFHDCLWPFVERRTHDDWRWFSTGPRALLLPLWEICSREQRRTAAALSSVFRYVEEGRCCWLLDFIRWSQPIWAVSSEQSGHFLIVPPSSPALLLQRGVEGGVGPAPTFPICALSFKSPRCQRRANSNNLSSRDDISLWGSKCQEEPLHFTPFVFLIQSAAIVRGKRRLLAICLFFLASSLHVYGIYTRATINYTCMRNIAPAFNYTLITKSSLSIKFLIKSTAFSLTPRGFGAHPAARFSLKPVWPVAFSIWLIIGLRPFFVALCNATIIPQNELIPRLLVFISHRETRACLLSDPK